MYTWNRHYINSLIKDLKKTKKNTIKNLIDVQSDINVLKDLKRKIPNIILHSNNIKKNLEEDKEDYINLKHYNNIINPAIIKYSEEPFYDINFKKIDTNNDDILLFTLDNIRNINKRWGQLLEPWIINKDTIIYKKNNSNYIIALKTLNEYFISLENNNNICDYVEPTHEFLHILWFLINHDAYTNIEGEFLSILGELITTYEMKNNNIYKNEVIKYEIDNINRLFAYISDIELRKKIIKIKKGTYKDLGINKDLIKNTLTSSLSYDYDTTISYFLAIELFEIYKVDKEKCIYIVEDIIKSNNKLNKKLKDNNIILHSNDKKYIKQLKKEYEIINNQ